MNQALQDTAGEVRATSGVVGLAILALIFIGLFHLAGFRVVVTTALRVGRP